MAPQEGERSESVAGLEIAITGRLASMTRGEAARRIAESGGRYVPAPTRETALVVVGQAAPPLGPDGRPSRAIARANELKEAGQAIEIVSEEELLARLGLGARADDIHRLYTAAQLARILDVSPAEVRTWVRLGLVRPAQSPHPKSRLSWFDFHEVAVARSLSRLEAAGVRPARIRRSLEQLRTWLDGAGPGSLEVLETSGALTVRLEDGTLADPDGQLQLDFDGEGEPAEDDLPRTPRFTLLAGGEGAPEVPTTVPRTTPWFEEALRAEADGDLERAAKAYRASLTEEGPLPETWFNLANVLYALKERVPAIEALTRVVESDPEHVEAWNNLGNLLSEEEREDEAVRAYRRALAIEPHYADAHFNLAVTLTTLGDTDGARRHYLAYLAEDPSSPWADEVHERLARLDG